MSTLVVADALTPWLSQLESANSIYVGYSGGLDSHALLHLLTQHFDPEQVTAVHINHGLSPYADRWQRHCVHQCQKLGIWCYTEKVDIDPKGEGIEAAARDARYGVFSRLVDTGDVLLLAHHADDQVETMLYNLLRGTGPKGLAGIPSSRSLGLGNLIRPLLPFSRRDLQRYVMKHNLVWIEDESNRDVRFDRNYLRHKVVPLIAERWPDYRDRMQHTANLCADTDRMMQQLAEDDLQRCEPEVARSGWKLNLDKLLKLSKPRQINVLRHWPTCYYLPAPGHRIIDTICNTLLTAREDAMPHVSWANAQMRRFRNHLYLMPPSTAQVNTQIEGSFLIWNGEGTLHLPNGGKLQGQTKKGEGLFLPLGDRLIVRFREGGERCQPNGRDRSNTLKKLFQEYALEPWWRESVPLIYLGDRLVAVGDLWINDGCQAHPNEEGLVLSWYPQ